MDYIPPSKKRGASPDSSPERDILKRTKALDDTETVKLVPKAQAWDFDVGALLDLPTHTSQAQEQEYGNNFKNYDRSKSLFLLCVIGTVDIQYHLLRYVFRCYTWASLLISFRSPLLPELFKMSPNMQPLILTSSFSHVASILSTQSCSFPIVEVNGTPPKPFLQLGLLHPLGGGKEPLDAIVVLDTKGKRRLVLPFGWGAGRHILDHVAGSAVKERFSDILRDGIKALEAEKHNGDFYDVARTYF